MAYFPWCKLISTWKDLHYILTFKRGIVVIVQLNAFSLLFIKIICGFFAGKSENFENSVRFESAPPKILTICPLLSYISKWNQ